MSGIGARETLLCELSGNRQGLKLSSAMALARIHRALQHHARFGSFSGFAIERGWEISRMESSYLPSKMWCLLTLNNLQSAFLQWPARPSAAGLHAVALARSSGLPLAPGLQQPDVAASLMCVLGAVRVILHTLQSSFSLWWSLFNVGINCIHHT